MPIQIQGAGGSVAEAGVFAAVPLHATAKPVPYGALGHYKYAGFTGILAAGLAANSELFQFRWSHATNFAIILEVRISAAVSTTFFAAGVPVQIDLARVGAWSTAGSGGTRPTIAALMKSRSSMGSSQVAASDIGIATTTGLAAGTKTTEATSMAALVAPGPITASLNGQIIAPGTILFSPDMGDGEHPLILGGAGGGAASDGFVVRSVAVPATGTWTVAIGIKWAEVTAF